MPSALHPIKNTSKPYACTNCGSENVSVIREDPQGVNPRLKCNIPTCQFLFNGADSLAALDAGIIKPSSQETLDSASEPDVEHIIPRDHQPKLFQGSNHLPPEVLNAPFEPQYSVPKKPAYVFVAKNGYIEFTNKMNFKRTAIRWSDKEFSVYELKPVKLTVDVNVMDH